MIFSSDDVVTREFLREQLESEDVTYLSHQLSYRYSLLVEHTENYAMIVEPTRMDRVSVYFSPWNVHE